MSELEKIEQEIEITEQNINMLRNLLHNQRSVLFNLLRERFFERKLIDSIVYHCRTGK